MELKISALLRMNVSYKDAARMLNINPRTIESNVYSLRKKFNLKKQENLSHFLSTIEN
ncbi:MAG: helix-turn-helix domain-containing protein [Chlorobiota bacterium]|jgi:DNA-binding CsgD family transcriptional regulator|nr:helix-turn-helix domain-containing protein [Chlorobiota bacterium]QQS67278.1 MAG: helix-turn-helix domain-containing protein [Chlorobiota bacterium]